MRVVIFDPDKKQRNIIRENINGQDFTVTEYSNGDQLVERIKVGDVDLMIADFEADGSGIDLINIILAADIREYPYIVFITDEEGEFHAIDCLGPIPGDFLVKPIKVKEFQARIQIAERTIALQNRLKKDKGDTGSLAIYDNLTNVLNKQAVYERAMAEHNRAQREEKQIGLGMLEVINLDQVEELHGEEIRDQAMKFVARATRANVRIYDLVGRWIGAKFLVLLPGVSNEDVEIVMTRIQKAITSIRVRIPEGDRLQLDVRIGYTVMEKKDPHPLYVLIEQANHALEAVTHLDQETVLLYQD